MKIFFTAAMRGGRQGAPWYEKILSLLNQYGEVLNEQVADSTMPPSGETDLTNREILERELKRLEGSSILVAEVTTPSLGVGALIAAATEKGKRVICLYRGKHTDSLSAIIQGQPKVEVYPYQTEADLAAVLHKILGYSLLGS